MAQKKPFYYSKTLWGLAILVLGRYADIPEEVKEILPIVGPEMIQHIVDAVGIALMLIGRWKAEKKLTILPSHAPLPWRKGL